MRLLPQTERYVDVFVAAFLGSAGAFLATLLLATAVRGLNNEARTETDLSHNGQNNGVQCPDVEEPKSTTSLPGELATEKPTPACDLEQVGSVYGFVTGRAKIDKNDTEAQQTVTRMKEAMIQRADGHTLMALVLVGRVDRVQFGPCKSGSNQTLAMDRAQWFKDFAREHLTQIDGIQAALGQAVMAAAGPLEVPTEHDCSGGGLECDAEARKRQRRVDVFACWAPKSTPTGEQQATADTP